ncbi:MAG: LytTR family DNA-binding domain-containing protein [Defluviitaleaceae bacterium]|nr:LytTR family DNA-binding domain-containing protein [Defluviitaleaceae bacterium]
MNVILCDDNSAERNSLRHNIKKFFTEQSCPVEIIEYENGESLLRDLETQKIKNANIAFLDIFMHGVDGIEVAKKIRARYEEMVLIFTTTSRSHALESYSVDALQYLVKPVKFSEMENALKKCMKIFAASLGFIEIICDKITVRVLFKDIFYVEVFGNDCVFHTAQKTIKSRVTLDEIQKQLDAGIFLRTHRSFIVNMRYIQNVADNDFVLTNGALVPIRKKDGLIVKQMYMDYVFEKRRES